MDVRLVFTEAVLTGREIEFRYGGRHYFESRTGERDWYIYCEETKVTQHFSSPRELTGSAILGGRPIFEIWNDICIDCIL